ncbi:MAG: aldo/keto reductase [Bacteroidales bacterium]|nr:aldo/keto reductase [Bacteroidales bacterium]
MDRRDFLKSMGAGVLATAALATGCDSPNKTKAEGFASGEVPTDKMTYRTGTHGEKVSLLGYGCMRLPSTEDGKDGNQTEGDLDQDRINELTDYAIAHGLNLFDTAPRYCKARSEIAMGKALSRHRRDEYLISTKLSNQNPALWNRQGSIEMFEQSLERLQVDYLDFYMLHCVGLPGRDKDGNQVSPHDAFMRRFIDNGMLEWLVEQRAKGRIRNLGFSYHGDVKVFDEALALHDKVHWDHVLIQHNYVNWQHADSLSDDGNADADSKYLYGELVKRDIPVFVMEPLLGGQLANLPQFAVDELKSRAPEQSLASWAFRFAGTMPRILTVLSGMTYMEHLQDNLRTMSPLQPLNDEEMETLLDIAERYADYPLVPCTGCQYCMPCPYGIDIPGNFAHYNKMVNEGNLVELGDNATSEDRKAYREARRAFLVGYNRSIDRQRQADHCIGCGRCLHECPQSINIPRKLADIEEAVRSYSV